MKTAIDVLASLAITAVAIAIFLELRAQQRRAEPTPALLAPCASLYAIARTPADSLYVAINRGDCVTR